MKIAFTFLILISAGLSALFADANQSSRVATSSTAMEFDEQVIPVGGEPGSIVVADVNHDGKLDLIVANTGDDTVSVLLGDGRGHFTPSPGSPFACGKSPNDIAVGDFDGDGNLDLIIADTSTPFLTILLGNGKGRFAPSPHSP